MFATAHLAKTMEHVYITMQTSVTVCRRSQERIVKQVSLRIYSSAMCSNTVYKLSLKNWKN